MMKFAPVLLLLAGSLAPLHAEEGPQPSADIDQIFQYFAPSEAPNQRPNLGAYLWIPPNTPKIRAVMVGIQNGLPINILENAAVRSVCRKHGIAQILLTPWAQDIGSVMLMDLTYDVTDPARTAVYDGYLQRLASVSGHNELLTAPIVPLAHSAFCDFPFNAAIRKPEQCLAAIPIKAGLPDVYKLYAAGGHAKTPDPSLCLRNVPILFINSASQETVSWSAYPHGMSAPGLGVYRVDQDDNPGTDYKPHDDLFGMSWDMMSGHFDMFPRDYQFLADWLDAIATARLPEHAGDPMKNLVLRDGWLVNGQIPASGDLPADFPMPAPYSEYKGKRDRAIWLPNGDLAQRLFQLGHDEPRKKIELFTFRDSAGQPVSLARSPMATMPKPELLLHDDGLFTLTTFHFVSPPDICTTAEKDIKANPNLPLTYANLLFPGASSLPVSGLPLQFNAHGGAFKLVHTEQFQDDRGVLESKITLRLIRHRLAPGAGFAMSFVRVFDEGNSDFAAAGRTCQISLAPSGVLKDASAQTVEFPHIDDVPATTPKIELHAHSSSGLPVDYFVRQGPGVIENGSFIPTEVPADFSQPIEVTIGAYQVGQFKVPGGTKPAETVFQTFHLMPSAKSN